MTNKWIRQYAICAFIVLSIFFIVNLMGDSETLEQKEFAQLVLKLAYEAKKVTGLPASIVAAQCILESGWGKYTVGNNYFGIKSDGTQPYLLSLTWEYDNKAKLYYQRVVKFRKYESLLESLIDYGNFIYKNPRYLKAIANKDNPIEYIHCIQYAGYATCPNYAQKILTIAEQCKFLTKSKWEINLTKGKLSCIIREYFIE